MSVTLVTGINFTFAVAVMPMLAGADDVTFVATLQRFNENPVFAITFTLALALVSLAALLERRHGPRGAARWIGAAAALYAIVFAITIGINVPLNEQLDQVGDPALVADLTAVRDTFEVPWVAANVLRTLLSTAAVGALARGILVHGRGTTRRVGRRFVLGDLPSRSRLHTR